MVFDHLNNIIIAEHLMFIIIMYFTFSDQEKRES